MIVQELVATLGLEVDEQAFERGLLALKGIGLGLAGIGAAVGTAVVGLGALVKQTADAAGSFDDLAQRTGANVETLQGLAYAAKFSDTSVEAVGDTLTKLADRMGKAKQGNDEMRYSFQKMGIAYTDGAGKLRATDEVFLDIATKIAAMPDGTEKTAKAMMILGESGKAMIPMLNQGGAGLRAFVEEARAAGIIFNADTIAQGARFGDEIERVKAAWLGFVYEVGGEFLGEFNEMLSALAKFMRENRKLITVPVIKFFRGLGAAMSFVKRNLDLLKGALLVVASFMAASYLTTLSTVTAAQLSWGAAALISGIRAAAGWALATAGAWLALAPIALLIAAVVLLADELLTFADGGDTLLGRWIKWLDSGTESGETLLEIFKALGSVIFDLTDPKKWQRLGNAIKEGVLVMLDKLLDGLEWVSDKFLGTDFAGKRAAEQNAARAGGNLVELGAGAQGAPFLPDYMAGRTSPVGPLFGPYSASPGATASTMPGSSTGVYSPNVNAQVTVNVGDGANPRQTGDAVANAVTGQWWGSPDMSANLVAVDQ